MCLCYGFVVAFCNFANDKVIHSRLRVEAREGQCVGRVSGRAAGAGEGSGQRVGVSNVGAATVQVVKP